MLHLKNFLINMKLICTLLKKKKEKEKKKAVVIERFHRTLKKTMWKYFTANNTRFYLDALDQMVKNYNEKVHSTIKMTPKEASKDINRGKVYFNIIRKQNKSCTSIKYKNVRKQI